MLGRIYKITRQLDSAKRQTFNQQQTITGYMEDNEALLSKGKIKYLNYENLETIPGKVLEDDEIRILHLKRNLFQTLPSTISSMVNLVELNLDSNFITDLPEDLKSLTNLKKLDLKQNKLKHIPEAIYFLSNLTSLNLFSNAITTIGNGIKRLQNLEELVVAYNKLNVLPESLCYCRLMKLLDLSNNDLKALPKQIVLLENLEELLVPYNNIIVMPFSINLLAKLKILDLYQNQLEAIPVELFSKRSTRDVTLKKSFSSTFFKADHVIKLIKDEFALQCITASRTPLSLKELTCRSLGNLYFRCVILPNELCYVMSCPIACCYICNQSIYCSAFYKFVDDSVLDNVLQFNGIDALYLRMALLLFCSYSCFTML